MSKYLLIFDLDGTIFNTDFLRNKRRTSFNSISESDFLNVKLIDGFDNIFLNPENPLYIKNHEVLFITSAPKNYARNLFKYALKELNINDYVLKHNCSPRQKYLAIANFINERYSGDSNILAFGDDEIDAFIYANLNIPYIIVNNYYGYNNFDFLLSEIVDKKDFRTTFESDIISTSYKSSYFDNIVVYYKRFYDNSVEENIPIIDSNGNENCIPGYFARNKSLYVKENLDYFVNEYTSIFNLNKNIYFAKVPGHDELFVNSKSPCSLLIEALCKKYGIKRNYSDLLTKNYETSKMSYGNDRNTIEILRSIKINRKLHGETIYLFDDIVTSGSTMSACVEKLYENGAGHVVCFCLGRTKSNKTSYNYNKNILKDIGQEIEIRKINEESIIVNKFLLFLKCLDGLGDSSIRKIVSKYSNHNLYKRICIIKHNIDIRNFLKENINCLKRGIAIDKIFNDSKLEIAKINRKLIISKEVCFVSWYNYKYFIRMFSMKSNNDFPILLFYKGNLELMVSNKICAIIGTREPSNNAIEIEKKIVKNMVSNKYVILSGLALGCDTVAHLECLINQGKTIAFLGSGLDYIYPKHNELLANNIIKNDGLLITEELPYNNVTKYSLINRDRLQASSVDEVIVIETSIEGGSMHAARKAYKYEKQLFVVDPFLLINNSGNKNLLEHYNAKKITI